MIRRLCYLVLVSVLTLIAFWVPTDRTQHTDAAGVSKPVVIAHAEPILEPSVVEVEPVAEISSPEPVAPVYAPVSGTHDDWMRQAGIAESDFGYVDYIVSHESSWNYLAVNSIGATGLCQSLPGSKMASAGNDYLSNPVTQLRWCASYSSRYGGWEGSYYAWVRQNWW